MLSINADVPRYEVVTASLYAGLVNPEDRPWRKFKTDPPECHAIILAVEKCDFITEDKQHFRYLLAQCPVCQSIYYHEFIS